MRRICYACRRVLLIASCVILASCDPTGTPTQRAVRFLELSQHRASGDAGIWPQFFWFEGIPGVRYREVSPFVVAFIHHSLARVTPENAGLLELRSEDVQRAREMRIRGMAFMRGFEARPEDPDAGTFGFWPYDCPTPTPEPLLERVMFEVLQGPILMGTRAPVHVRFYPRRLAIPCDADVTGAVYAAMLDDAVLDGGPGSAVPFEGFFEDWRDTGATPLRLNPDWLPEASGAFLTWLNYRETGGAAVPNDVDLVVNATVLYALGRYGRLDTPGVAEAVALINSAVAQGLHRRRHEEITAYYPDNLAFHYFVSRAYFEGGVLDLGPAVRILAKDLTQEALIPEEGVACWDRGHPHLNTAFAVLTLLNGGSDSPLIASGIRYLLAEQNALTGGWEEGIFFIARLDGGQQVCWGSSSFTTAMALEALCRYALADG